MWQLIKGETRPIDSLPLEDRGFLLGDGVFETLRVEAGIIRNSALHARSLQEACAAFSLCPPNWSEIRSAIGDLTKGQSRAIAKLIVTRGSGGRGLAPIRHQKEGVFLEVSNFPKRLDSVRLASVDIHRSATSLGSRFKTLSYADNLAARRHAIAQGGDFGLLQTESGFLSGCDCANLFWSVSDRVLTPSDRCGIRKGIMRERVIDWLQKTGKDVEFVESDASALVNADAVWITNALMGAVPVSAVDDQVFATDQALLKDIQVASL